MLVELDVLVTQLLTVAALTKVIVEIVKVYLPEFAPNSQTKWAWSLAIPVFLCLITGIGLFETGNVVLQYFGMAGAGLIASLGSNFIHEFMKVLETVKSLKKQ